jgi:hypothetical protein
VLDYPGWDNDRMCHVGLLSKPGPDGRRAICQNFARELQRQMPLFQHAHARNADLSLRANERL